MNRLCRLRCVLVFCSLGFLVACATQRVYREDDQRSTENLLFMTRSGDKVNLSWESQPDKAYTVLYNSSYSASTPWQVLPGMDFIRGTGRTITYEDQVPAHVNRYYRLRVQPAISLSN